MPAIDPDSFCTPLTKTPRPSVAFGADGPVRSRLERFLQSGGWKPVLDEPYILLDLVLEGLYLQVDENVWNMNAALGAVEHVRSVIPAKSFSHANS